MKQLLALAVLLAAFTCQAQTAWPAYIHVLKSDRSDSRVAAVLPSDAAITRRARTFSPNADVVHRGEAQFVGEELHLRLHTGTNLVLRLRADGAMEMALWRPETQLLSAAC